jgi:hypothetical protein
MSKFNTVSFGNEEAPEYVTGADTFSGAQYPSAAIDSSSRVTELERENSRLHRLVAELLLKNQQLRKQDEIQD